MGELGEWLRTAREGQSLSLEQAAEQTRIPLGYLKALEEEDFSQFSSSLHVRGFLRTYASGLGLEAERAIELCAAATSAPRRKRVGSRGKTPAPAVPPRSPVSAGEEGSQPSTLVPDVMLALAVLLLLALSGLAVYHFRLRPQVAAVPTEGPAPTPSPTPLPVFEGTDYTMDVQLDYAGHKLAVQQRVDYTNVTSQTLSDLMLNVHPNHIRNAFKLNRLRVEVDGKQETAEVSQVGVTLRVQLPRELGALERVTLYLDFQLSLPQISPGAEFSDGGFGYSKRSVSLGNWYPVVAPYRKDKGWYGLTYFPVGDPFVTEVADYRVTITATEGIVLAGTGKETRTGSVWSYEVDQARSFAFAASDRWQVASRQAGGVTVLAYTFPGNEPAGEAVLQTAAQSLELFGELYGPYPYAEYRVAETEFAGGMEYTGLTFLGAAFYEQYDGTSRSGLIPLTAHEAAHQWFFGLVGSDQVTEPWLDEALAEYSGYLYYERVLPGDAQWWWSYAVDQWAPTGKIDYLIYEFRDNRGYTDAVYRRGAEFVRDLRQVMSDPAFFGFLKEYQRRHAYRLATSREFFSLVGEFTTADLVPLQEEYFRQRVLP
ncbi:MAG TPA: helix-turn-helix domain-containing protein [Anaerolineae bacterium]|nr:helix-turn-helix domain-containing protein [Anaerolineae bacterium]